MFELSRSAAFQLRKGTSVDVLCSRLLMDGTGVTEWLGHAARRLQEEAQWPGRLHPPWWWEKPPDWVRELPWWLSGNTEDLKDRGDHHPEHKKAG